MPKSRLHHVLTPPQLAIDLTMRLMLGAPAVYIGARILSSNVRNWREASAVAKWDRTPARILEAPITRVGKEHGHDTHYRIDLTYSYEVGRRAYVGTRVRVGSQPTWGDGSAAKAAQREYLQRRDVTARVDPQNPTAAVLEPRKHGHLLFALCVGVGSTALGLHVLLFG